MNVILGGLVQVLKSLKKRLNTETQRERPRCGNVGERLREIKDGGGGGERVSTSKCEFQGKKKGNKVRREGERKRKKWRNTLLNIMAKKRERFSELIKSMNHPGLRAQ